MFSYSFLFLAASVFLLRTCRQYGKNGENLIREEILEKEACKLQLKFSNPSSQRMRKAAKRHKSAAENFSTSHLYNSPFSSHFCTKVKPWIIDQHGQFQQQF